MATEKYRFWAFIYYPDNYDSDVLDDLLKSLHIDFLHSPLHQPDSEYSKHHFHYILLWSGPTTAKHINENVLGSISHPCMINCTHAFPLFQVNGYIRYLIHLDNPEKQQFSKDEIFQFGKIAHNQLEEAFEVGDYDAVMLTREICDFICANGVRELPELLFYASNNFPKWAYLLYKRVPDAVKMCLNSMRWSGNGYR